MVASFSPMAGMLPTTVTMALRTTHDPVLNVPASVGLLWAPSAAMTAPS